MKEESSLESQQTADIAASKQDVSLASSYPGDFQDETPISEYRTFDFPNPFLLVAFYDKEIADGHVVLHPWQREVSIDLSCTSKKPTAKEPYKYCLLAANGSGKDKFVIAPFAIWFSLTKIRARVIITTSSGTQLTSQTEPYIKDLCEKVNAFHGQEVYRIRQRYIRCMLTGSEIRMFATDESGKAEGYHPIDANSEMAIVVNEGKSVTEDIHRALRRCTGYNYWLEVSSAGEPKGYLYDSYTKSELSFTTKRITSYECPHVSQKEIQDDILLDGEHSAYFRSKHLSLFTSLSGMAVIPMELVNSILDNPPKHFGSDWPVRIGIDLAAGGDENVIIGCQGNKVKFEFAFRETDTVLAAQKINSYLSDKQISKDCETIFADDGGVGRGIIDQLDSLGWTINRVMNQWPALGNKKQFANRGAENWYRLKRILEEKLFDLKGLSKKAVEQLSLRYYKQSLANGKIALEDKREAKSHGRPSPDRADAFVLSFSGLTADDFLNTRNPEKEDKKVPQLRGAAEIEAYFEENDYTFYDESQLRGGTRRINNSLAVALEAMNANE